MPARQPGHVSTAPDASYSTAARSPQWGQNSAPTNIDPRHAGHATVAMREPQYSQLTASGLVPAPQFGQFRLMSGDELRRT